jgi:hypothetical protein
MSEPSTPPSNPLNMPVALLLAGLNSLPTLIELFETLAADAKRTGRLSDQESADLEAAIKNLNDAKAKPSWWLTDEERAAQG